MLAVNDCFLVYSILWQFTVSASQKAGFVSAYSPAGAWAQLFARSPDFIATELIQDVRNPTLYLTVDRWKSAAAYETFTRTFRSEYQALDAQFQSLSSEQHLIGHFESID
jgi:heme-degrading monooxygenase HmoA